MSFYSESHPSDNGTYVRRLIWTTRYYKSSSQEADPIPDPQIVYLFRRATLFDLIDATDTTHEFLMNLFDWENMKLPLRERTPSPLDLTIKNEIVPSDDETLTADERVPSSNDESDSSDWTATTPSSGDSPNYAIPDAPPSLATYPPPLLPPVYSEPMLGEPGPSSSRRRYQAHAQIQVQRSEAPVPGAHQLLLRGQYGMRNVLQRPNQFEMLFHHYNVSRSLNSYFVPQIHPPHIRYRPVEPLPEEWYAPGNRMKRQVYMISRYLDPDINPTL